MIVYRAGHDESEICADSPRPKIRQISIGNLRNGQSAIKVALSRVRTLALV
jgi:hypothetical protein